LGYRFTRPTKLIAAGEHTNLRIETYSHFHNQNARQRFCYAEAECLFKINLNNQSFLAVLRLLALHWLGPIFIRGSV